MNSIPVTKNLTQYIKNRLAETGGSLAGTSVLYGMTEPVDRECIIVRESSSATRNFPDNKEDLTIQIAIQFRDFAKAEGAGFLLYNLIGEAEHSLELPAPTGATGEGAVLVDRLTCISRPTSLGMVNGYYRFTLNVTLTYFAVG